MRCTARLAAYALLCLVLVPVHAGEPSPGYPPTRCDNGGRSVPSATPCPEGQKPDEPVRRRRLGNETKRECGLLQTAILELEASERGPRPAMMESVQQDLAALRKRYKKLGCQDS